MRALFGSLAALALPALVACNGQITDAIALGGPAGGGSARRTPTPENCEYCLGESPIPRLTRVEYERTLRAVFDDAFAEDLRFDFLPSDGRAGPFASNAFFDVDDDGVEGYRAVAEAAGDVAGARATELLGCASPASASCLESFLDRYGTALYRRPLRDEERAAYLALATGRSEADFVRLAITAMLQSPHFLYRIELGEPTGDPAVVKLTGYEIATRLSFFLWKSAPDEELMAAAAAGDLATAEGVEAQARRMLGDPRADYTIVRFHTDWLGITEIEHHTVNETRFPDFAAISDDMLAETEEFALHVFRDADASLSTLLTAPYSFASPELAAHYGLDAPATTGISRIELDGTERAGILTQASFLTVHAHDPTTAGVHRGKAIRERFLCQTLPNPPPIDTLIAPDPSLSTRQQLEQKTSPETCTSCHRLMNPLGFTFEHYDAIGAFRTMDGTHAIDASGAAHDSDIEGPIDGAIDLANRLAASEQVHQCVARQWLRAALGRPDLPLDEQSLDAAYARYDGSGRDLRELVVALTTTDAFRFRRIPPSE